MNGDPRPDVRELTREDLHVRFREWDEKLFRADQVYEWLWKKGIRSFDLMTNLPLPVRSRLSETYAFPSVVAESRLDSKDGTKKMVFRLFDGNAVEGVLIPSRGRTTACISSQAGCPLGCTFCATGRLGFTRNLTRGEIFDQVVILNDLSLKNHGVPLSNIVYMGMGEPLLNYASSVGSVERITATDGLGVSPQRITLSSVGIPRMIRQLADDNIKVHFALSLHVASNEKRDKIIPVNKKYPLETLIEALEYYHSKTGKRFTIEYLLLGGFNDSEKDATDLARFCKHFPVKINLIEYNPAGDEQFTSSSLFQVKKFAGWLEKRNLVVNIRQSRGNDIEAACGQLALKYRVQPGTKN